MRSNTASKLVIILIVIALLPISYLTVNTTLSKLFQPERGVLVVGTSTPFPPFEMRIGEKVVGLDIDLAEKIAKQANMKLIIKDFSDFDALLPSLKSGTIDMVIAGLTITNARKELFDFSVPYYTSAQSILTLQDGNFSGLIISKSEDFSSLKIGYQSQTTSQFWIEDNLLCMNCSDAESNTTISSDVVSFGNLGLGIEYLKLGIIDVIIIDKPVADSFASLYSELTVIGILETNEQYGIAVQKDDPQHILPVINEILTNLQESDEYGKLLEKWFGG